jgi:ribosomal protein S18 acetylase RimI-like enzyme
LSAVVQRITPDYLDIFKAVRLRALQEAPYAFGSTYEREANFSEKDWLARIERWNGEAGIGFLAMDRDVPCGILGAFLDQADGSRVEILSMWTAPTYRRKGVGSLLINSVVAWARSRKARALRLMVTHRNESAIRFYKRLGFAMTGRTEPYPNDPDIIELEMVLVI